MSKRCPKCKGTKFSVKVLCFQDWDSETDDYSELEVIETMSEEDTYFCRGCESVFESEDDLEDIDKCSQCLESIEDCDCESGRL